MTCNFGGFLGSADLQLPPAPPHPWALAIQRPEAIKVSIITHDTTSDSTFNNHTSSTAISDSLRCRGRTIRYPRSRLLGEVTKSDSTGCYPGMVHNPYTILVCGGGSIDPDCDPSALTAASLEVAFRDDGNI